MRPSRTMSTTISSRLTEWRKLIALREERDQAEAIGAARSTVTPEGDRRHRYVATALRLSNGAFRLLFQMQHERRKYGEGDLEGLEEVYGAAAGGGSGAGAGRGCRRAARGVGPGLGGPRRRGRRGPENRPVKTKPRRRKSLAEVDGRAIISAAADGDIGGPGRVRGRTARSRRSRRAATGVRRAPRIATISSDGRTVVTLFDKSVWIRRLFTAGDVGGQEGLRRYPVFRHRRGAWRAVRDAGRREVGAGNRERRLLHGVERRGDKSSRVVIIDDTLDRQEARYRRVRNRAHLRRSGQGFPERPSRCRRH